MSFSFGGLIIKPAVTSADEMLLSELGKSNYKFSRQVTLQEAASRELEGIGIYHHGNATIIFNRDLPYACSFDPDQPSGGDRRLSDMSQERDIICFTLNGTSESYAFAWFSDGTMRRARSVSAGEELTNAGTPAAFETPGNLDETHILSVIENFSEIPFPEFVSEGTPAVKVYNEL